MERKDLPPGLMVLIKDAVRQMVLACAAPGSTGAQRVQQITGHSAGAVSRWQGDNYAELPPLEIIVLLEQTTQQPVFARALAALTGHRLVPVDEGEATADSFVADIVAMTRTSSAVTAALAQAIEDGDLTRSEANVVMKLLAPQEKVIGEIKRKLAGIKPRGGNP